MKMIGRNSYELISQYYFDTKHKAPADEKFQNFFEKWPPLYRRSWLSG